MERYDRSLGWRFVVGFGGRASHATLAKRIPPRRKVGHQIGSDAPSTTNPATPRDVNIADAIQAMVRKIQRGIVRPQVPISTCEKFLTRFLAGSKLLKLMVARDGIEPPTPAFSGPPTESRKWFEINESC